MPIIKKCRVCGDIAPHGFQPVNGGMYLYHGKCQYYEGNNGKLYLSHLELFKGVVEPETPKTPENKIWIKARIADLTGHPRIAKKLYRQWNTYPRGG